MIPAALRRGFAVLYRNIVFPIASVLLVPGYMLESALNQHAPAGHMLADMFHQTKSAFLLGLFGLFAAWLAFHLLQTARLNRKAHQSFDAADLAHILLELIPASPPARPLEKIIRALGRPLAEPWTRYERLVPMLLMLGFLFILIAPDGSLSALLGPRFASSEARLQLLLCAIPLLTVVSLRLWALHEHQRLRARMHDSLPPRLTSQTR